MRGCCPREAPTVEGKEAHVVQRIDVDARLLQQQPYQGGVPVPRRNVQQLGLVHRARIYVAARRQVPRHRRHVPHLQRVSARKKVMTYALAWSLMKEMY